MEKQQPACTLLVILALWFSPALASAGEDAIRTTAPTLMQMGKLTASDQGGNFGTPLAASGNTLVAGGLSSTGSPETYVFVKPSTGWGSSTESAKLVPSNGTALFGAVAISENTIAVLGFETTLTFDVYIFVRPASGWSGNVTETAILNASGQSCFGSVSLSGDTVLTTSLGLGAIESGACIFVKPASGWKNTSEANATLSAPFNGSSSSVSASISGDDAVIGVPGNAFNEGTVYVYVKPSTGWSGSLLNPTATLIASNTSKTTGLGGVVSISGSTIVASAGILGTYRNEVLVFVEPPGGWTNTTETARLLEPPNGEGFAFSLSISGNQVLVGAIYATVGFNQLEGAAYVYTKPQSGWKTTTTFNTELTASDGAVNDAFGSSVAIGGGNFFVGSPHSTQSHGAVYVFEP